MLAHKGNVSWVGKVKLVKFIPKRFQCEFCLIHTRPALVFTEQCNIGPQIRVDLNHYSGPSKQRLVGLTVLSYERFIMVVCMENILHYFLPGQNDPESILKVVAS